MNMWVLCEGAADEKPSIGTLRVIRDSSGQVRCFGSKPKKVLLSWVWDELLNSLLAGFYAPAYAIGCGTSTMKHVIVGLPGWRCLILCYSADVIQYAACVVCV